MRQELLALAVCRAGKDGGCIRRNSRSMADKTFGDTPRPPHGRNKPTILQLRSVGLVGSHHMGQKWQAVHDSLVSGREARGELLPDLIFFGAVPERLGQEADSHGGEAGKPSPGLIEMALVKSFNPKLVE